MRADPTKDDNFRDSEQWSSPREDLPIQVFKEDGTRELFSFSGHERDHLYMNSAGKRFVDVSPLSGLDHIGDGRSFAYLDYDRDGWLDLALVGVNAPRLQVFRNELARSNQGHNHVRLQLRGSNSGARPSHGKSNRNGYGAKLTMTLPDGSMLYRHHQCGAGLAAQNSSVLCIGIGKAERISKLNIEWPSGLVQRLHNISAGTSLEVTEGRTANPYSSEE
ncbi:MAG: CRTAC1 family protein [Akkermansiaceae bacterium]|nr:CRTAC1 family protein [Akkermansiaceae bacterium]